MEEQLENLADKCRCCLDEITNTKVEIDETIDGKFFEMTQTNFTATDLLPPYICYDCYEILISYSDCRQKFIENQQKLERILVNTEDVIEYEEVEVREDELDQIIIEERLSMETEEIEQEESEEEEEELRLEDIVKPEFLHYCLPKKEPEPAKKVFHIPRQLEKKKHKLEQILQEQKNQDTSLPFCQECGMQFTSTVLLQDHVSKAHRKYACDFEECSKTFISEFQLNKHISAHHKKSLFECQYCDKKFSQKLHLKNHLYTHPEKS